MRFSRVRSRIVWTSSSRSTNWSCLMAWVTLRRSKQPTGLHRSLSRDWAAYRDKRRGATLARAGGHRGRTAATIAGLARQYGAMETTGAFTFTETVDIGYMSRE